MLLAGWLALVAWLAVARPRDLGLVGAARLVPDAARLVRRLAADRTVPRRARLPVWLLLAYLACPIDIVPDVLPVVGYADDVVLVSVVLRRFVRRAGPAKLAEHWPGTPEGLAAFRAALRC